MNNWLFGTYQLPLLGQKLPRHHPGLEPATPGVRILRPDLRNVQERCSQSSTDRTRRRFWHAAKSQRSISVPGRNVDLHMLIQQAVATTFLEVWWPRVPRWTWYGNSASTLAMKASRSIDWLLVPDISSPVG